MAKFWPSPKLSANKTCNLQTSTRDADLGELAHSPLNRSVEVAKQTSGSQGLHLPRGKAEAREPGHAGLTSSLPRHPTDLVGTPPTSTAVVASFDARAGAPREDAASERGYAPGEPVHHGFASRASLIGTTPRTGLQHGRWAAQTRRRPTQSSAEAVAAALFPLDHRICRSVRCQLQAQGHKGELEIDAAV